MSDAIAKFYATPIEVNVSGGDGARIVLSVRDTVEDLQGALLLAGMKGCNLNIVASVANKEISFQASIAPIGTALSFKTNRPPVIKLDCTTINTALAMNLIGHTENVMRFEISIAGEKEKGKSKIKLVSPPSPYGQFWNYLDKKNFLYAPELNNLFVQLEIAHKIADRKELVRICFGGKRSEVVSPKKLRDWLKLDRISPSSNLFKMIDKAEQYAEEKARAA